MTALVLHRRRLRAFLWHCQGCGERVLVCRVEEKSARARWTRQLLIPPALCDPAMRTAEAFRREAAVVCLRCLSLGYVPQHSLHSQRNRSGAGGAAGR